MSEVELLQAENKRLRRRIQTLESDREALIKALGENQAEKIILQAAKGGGGR